MNNSEVAELQQHLLETGFYTGKVDGIWGPLTEQAVEMEKRWYNLRADSNCPDKVPARGELLAWGARVSATFRNRVRWIADELYMPADGAHWLMACMAFESGETFRSDIRNAAGSGATGLIQFMPRTAEALGTSTSDLAAMKPEDQLNFVYKYFRPYRGKLHTLADVYMAILWPAAVGKPADHVLWSRDTRPVTYRQNSGLDSNADGVITKEEASDKVYAKLMKGRSPDLMA